MLASVTHILALTTILRRRMLPIPGRVTARKNQKVSASDVVAEAEFAEEHLLIDVARQLGISPKAADKLITCKVGDTLRKDAVIADGGGLIPNLVKTPRAGQVIAVGGGQVLMNAGDSTVELKAGIPGEVIEIIPNRGVILQNTGSLIQGIWGNGKIDTGLLRTLPISPEEPLKPENLDIEFRGAILLGSYCGSAETLNAAAELPVRGLILSGIHPSLLPLARRMSYPILVTDGFGPRVMNRAAYKILSTSAERETTLCAEPYDRFEGTRPEIVIPVQVAQLPSEPREIETFAPEQKVLLLRNPYAGEIGMLTHLRPGLTQFPSGLRAAAGNVRLENGEEILVPLINLEVVG